MVQLSYRRPRFIEVHDQSWCPPTIRQHLQDVLTFLWNHRIPPFQSRAPYEAAADILESVVREIEEESSEIEKQKGQLRVVDCCSGAGGPMPMIERRVNANRRAEDRPAMQVLLSDLHPHISAWTKHANASSAALSFLPCSVDATHAPSDVRKGRHIRTFCLSFHHFGEEGARGVLEDAMRSAEAILIFELQEPNLGSILTILALFPLTWLITPFMRPTLFVLFFTYIIPILPAILVFDGLISAWRTRNIKHIQHLAGLAQMTLNLEGKADDCAGWEWTETRSTHTRPFGKMFAITGRRVDVNEARSEHTAWTHIPESPYVESFSLESEDEQ